MAFRRAGRGREADLLLRAAIRGNAFVPAYLLGREPLPRQLPEYIGFGDRNEAIVYAAENLKLWQGTPGALEWLQALARAA